MMDHHRVLVRQASLTERAPCAPACTEKRGAPMGWFHPPRGSYQPEQMQLLQEAFDATWAELATHLPSPNGKTDHELRTAISEKLCDLAATGVTDPERQIGRASCRERG